MIPIRSPRKQLVGEQSVDGVTCTTDIHRRSILIGNTVYWSAMYTTTQSVFVRFMPSSNLSKARKILWLQIPYMSFTYFMWCVFGFVLYAYYHECDPFITRRIARTDTLLVLYVNDVGSHIPGFLGFFMAGLYICAFRALVPDCVATLGLFSGSMSSVSSSLNSLATISNEHLISKLRIEYGFLKSGGIWLVRSLAIILGLVVLPIAALVAPLVANTLKGRISIANIFACPTYGVFLLGFFNPRANSRGAICGLTAGELDRRGSRLSFNYGTGILLGFYFISTHYLFYAGNSRPTGTSVAGCPKYYCERVGLQQNDTGCIQENYTLINPATKPPPTSATKQAFRTGKFMFAWSYQLAGIAAAVFTFVVGSLVSECSPGTKRREDINDFLAPFLNHT